MSQTLWVFIGLCLALAVGERIRYDNYRVFEVTASHVDHLKTLQELEASSDSLLFLEGPYSLSRPLQVVVAPHKVPDFMSVLARNEISHKLIEKNAQKFIDQEDIGGATRSGYGWSGYHQLNETYSWLESLAKAYPEQVTLINGGRSYENRPINGVLISFKKGNKPGIFVEGGIHAREWISPATVTYIINELLTSPEASIRDIAESYDWYIFPHANPDGYVYTWDTDRMWRKTRKPYGACYGADPNRNWDFYWNTVGASSNPCSETYAGPSPASEIEVKTLSNYILSLKGKIQLYLSFHSFSQYLLYPYGHTSELPANANDLKEIFNATTKALSKRYGTKYTGGNIYDAIYPASGASIDWAYHYVKTLLAFCYELRPSSSGGGYGFQLPASQIIPTATEIVDSLVAMIGKARELKYL